MERDMLHNLGSLAPDLLEEISKRAWVLERIAVLQPIGRRALALRLRMPEREVRAVAQALRDAGHITLDAAGMCITPQAEPLLEDARALSHRLRGLSMLEGALSRQLGIHRVVIVPGNVDQDPEVLREVGRIAAQRLRTLLLPGDVLAVTGGSTIQQVAAHLPNGASLDVLVLPARGGMGRAVETQADTLAAEFARKLGGHHRLLHLPDQMAQGAWQELLKMPEVRETIDLLHRTDVLLYGIGRTDEMMASRRLNADVVQQITDKGAVAEAFGYYFDEKGKAVYAASSLGLDLTAMGGVRTVIAVAAGASKAEAIQAVMRSREHELLVTDEGAATRMLELCKASGIDNSASA